MTFEVALQVAALRVIGEQFGFGAVSAKCWQAVNYVKGKALCTPPLVFLLGQLSHMDHAAMCSGCSLFESWCWHRLGVSLQRDSQTEDELR